MTGDPWNLMAVAVLVWQTSWSAAFVPLWTSSSSSSWNGVCLRTRARSPVRLQSSSSSSSSSGGSEASTVTATEGDTGDAAAAAAGHSEFLARTKLLCEERNLPLSKVKNARDLASVPGCPIVPGRIFRMGRVSDATDADRQVLFEDKSIKTLVDLRSPTELKDDPTLEREVVYKNFTSIVWTGKGLCIREIKPGEPRIRHQRKRKFLRGLVARLLGDDDEEDDDDDIALKDDEECIVLSKPTDRKERHFVSLMNELKYVRGTLSKLRKRDIASVVAKSPGALFSRRVRRGVKGVFLDEINEGGLPMLNELVLRYGAPGIYYVLELCADPSRHPISLYCTAGKDRTGIIAAILLSLVGVPDEQIVEDYSLSANVYAEMNDHKAMVGALSQRNLNPKTFLGAPPQVMRDTLQGIRETYGSVEEYLTWIGFGPQRQEKLKQALLQ